MPETQEQDYLDTLEETIKGLEKKISPILNWQVNQQKEKEEESKAYIQKEDNIDELISKIKRI